MSMWRAVTAVVAIGAGGLGVGVAGFAHAQSKLQREAVLFGLREGNSSVNISPDGTRVVYIAASKGGASLAMVRPVVGGEARQVAMSDGAPFRLNWCDWASNKRIICQLYGVTDRNQLNQYMGFTRLLSFDASGSNLTELGIKTRKGFVVDQQSDGRVIAWLNDDTALIERPHLPENEQRFTATSRMDYGVAVDRVDLSSGKSKNVIFPDPQAMNYLADELGKVRVKGSWHMDDAAKKDAYRYVYHYRKKGSDEWHLFSRVVDENGLTPLALAPGGEAVYASGKVKGRSALHLVKLDGSMASEMLVANENVDIDTLLVLGKRGKVFGASWVTDRREVKYFDTELQTLAKRLGALFEGKSAISFQSASQDERKLIVSVSSDIDPGRYYLYDRDRASIEPVLQARPVLNGVALARVEPITYRAADGTNIPGYLTLPPSGTRKNLPAIVMPHGGPAARDEWGFDWLAQYFASRGYAVLQPNFRGSSGYGDDWFVNNGLQSWPLAIKDINAGGRWLIDQGIADPSKLGIVGWSYGGYAALQTNVIEPDLYKAIVAIAPVVDLEMLVTDSRLQGDTRSRRRQIGRGEHVAAGSPRRHASSIKAPVLMFSGDADINVDVRHAREMREELRKAGKQVELVIYPKLDHQIPDSNARIDMLQKADAFLRKNMKVSN